MVLGARVRHCRLRLDRGMDPCTYIHIEQHPYDTFLQISLDSCLDNGYPLDMPGPPAGDRHRTHHRIHGARTGSRLVDVSFFDTELKPGYQNLCNQLVIRTKDLMPTR